MITKEISTKLPPSLELRDVPVAAALVALANELVALGERMPLARDVSLELVVEPGGRCALHFRAT